MTSLFTSGAEGGSDLPAAGLCLQSVKLDQFRRFATPMELTGLSPGLNILSGPNEAGKSTVVRAIRAAFFERHRSTAVEDLRPWGDSSASPTVELEFDFEGKRYRLLKSFLGRKRCVLETEGQTLEGVEAEDHLARLFGFTFAAKGASKPEHWGIPGLLWVEQGTGQDLDVSHARGHLHDALVAQSGSEQNSTAGELAATGGDQLLATLQAERRELLTGTGKPRGALADAQAQVELLSDQLRALDEQVERYRQEVDQLSELRRAHGVDEREQPWIGLLKQVEQARGRLQEAQAQQQALAADQLRLRQLDQHEKLLAEQLAQNTSLEQTMRNRAMAVEHLTLKLQAAQDALVHARNAADAAAEETRRWNALLQSARQEALRGELQAGVTQGRERLRAQKETLQSAQAAHQEVRPLEEEAALLRLEAADMARLRQLERTEREAALKLQAVSTRILYRLPPGVQVDLCNKEATEALAASGERLLDAETTLRWADGSEITITPGGQDLSALGRAQQEAAQAMRRALAQWGLADLAAAEARLAAYGDAQERLKMARQTLALLAPKGLAVLESELTQTRARLSTQENALAALPGPQAAQGATPSESECTHALTLASQSEQVSQKALARAQQQQALAQGEHAAATQEWQAAQGWLEDAARLNRLQAMQAQWLSLQMQQQAVASAVAAAQERLAEARPDILAQDMERLRRSAEQQQADHRQRELRLKLMEQSLQQAGAQGLEEQRATTEGELLRAQRRSGELGRRAAALDLLCERLQSKREAALARLQSPLQDRLQHYLPLVWPGARVRMEDNLEPSRLRRDESQDGERGRVEALSFGTREQLGLVSRFAYADLLRQAGRPTLLILDDVLVHSDAQRLALMKRVLFDAAQRHQVLLLTCHPEDWRDMGVSIRSLC
jgi:DNA repair exonuclease SbcCD ATPase subunit